MYQEIDNYEIYTNKLLEKLDYFVNPENNQDISVLLEAKLEDAPSDPAASSSEDIPAPAASSSPVPNLTVQTNLTTDMDIDTSPPLQTPLPSKIPRPLPQTPPSPPIKKETSQGKRQRLNERQYDRPGSPISFGGRKKTKNKNKKVINKKTKKKYKNKCKIVYKTKNVRKKITKKKKTKKNKQNKNWN